MDLEALVFNVTAKANKNLIKNINEIIYSGLSDKGQEVRPKWADGTSAHTFYTIGQFDTFNLSQGEIPITTLRPVAWKEAIKEILWIYQKKNNDVNFLKDHYGVKYWDSWKNKEGNLGTAYGYQIGKVLKYPEGNFDQMDRVLYLLKNDPMNRRIMTTMIDMEEMKDMTLVPCAFMTLWSVRDNFVDMTLIQRSNDLVAAQSINAFQYAVLLIMVANSIGKKPGVFRHFIQNMHIYDRHIQIAHEMKNQNIYVDDLLFKVNIKDFYSYNIEDFELINYNPSKQIGKIEIAT